MSRYDEYDMNAHDSTRFGRLTFSTLAEPSQDRLPEALTAALESVDVQARSDFPDVFAKVDALKAVPSWRPSWAPDVCGKCGSSDWLVWNDGRRRNRRCRECGRRYQRMRARKAG